MKTMLKIAITLAVLLAIAASCSGAMGLGSTINGLRSVVVQSKPGSAIYQSPSGGQFMFVWRQGTSYAVAWLDQTGKFVPAQDGIAECHNCYSISETIQAFLGAGWKQVQPDRLPANIVNALGSAEATTLFARNLVLPVFVILPVAVFTPMPGQIQNPMVQ